MEIIRSTQAMIQADWHNKKVGFVPTMGALHQGHLSLIAKSQKENDLTVVSILVNPTQFNDPKDFDRYPRLEGEDLEKLKNLCVDVVFLPDPEAMYPESSQYRIEEFEISKIMEGAHRPGHFAGVLTIVMKLFQLVRPTIAYFGKKDFQQGKLLQGMVEAFFLQVRVELCETIRDERGLALSSRNLQLDQGQRVKASLLYLTLNDPELSLKDKRVKLISNGFEVEYLAPYNGRLFAAAKFADIRLIDNVSWQENSV